jgi:hypothetical protein
MVAFVYLKAVLLGVAIVAPVSSMSVLFHPADARPRMGARQADPLGIATGDGFYALLAALGLAGVHVSCWCTIRMLHVAAGLFFSTSGTVFVIRSYARCSRARIPGGPAL